MSKDAQTPLPPGRSRRPLVVHRATAAVGLLMVIVVSGGADGTTGEVVDMIARQADQLGRQVLREGQAWYRQTPPMERVTWGALTGCAFLGLITTLERSWRLRRGKVVPEAFRERFLRRLSAGQLDRGKGLDYCELNPSPAAHVAQAAVQRWGRPASDLERGVALARQREVDRLRRNVGTLRRVAALAPLIGLLGTLTAASRSLAAAGPDSAWGPAVAGALGPLTVGVGIAILAMVLYDGLTGRVEALASELDHVGAETVDAIALQMPSSPEPAVIPASPIDPRPIRTDAGTAARPPHAVRIPVQSRSPAR